MSMKTVADPLEAPDWFTTRCQELSRLLASSPKSVADGLWWELIKRGLVTPTGEAVPTRVLGWTAPDTHASNTSSGSVVQ